MPSISGISIPKAVCITRVPLARVFQTRFSKHPFGQQLDKLKPEPPADLPAAGDPLDRLIQWVRPELIAEVEYTAWSGSGCVRHAVYLGLREDKSPEEVIRDVADREVERSVFKGGVVRKSRGWKGAILPIVRPVAAPARIVVAKAPRKPHTVVGSVELSHPDKRTLARRHEAQLSRNTGRQSPLMLCRGWPGVSACFDPSFDVRMELVANISSRRTATAIFRFFANSRGVSLRLSLSGYR